MKSWTRFLPLFFVRWYASRTMQVWAASSLTGTFVEGPDGCWFKVSP